MAAPTINSELLIAGFLRAAKLKPDPLAWLNERHGEALDAVAAGDEFITSSSTEGGGSSAERGINAQTLLSLYEAALQAYEAGVAAGSGGPPGSVRFADFSQYPCVLG